MITLEKLNNTPTNKYGQMGFIPGSCMTDQVTKDEGLLHARIWMTICLLVNFPIAWLWGTVRFSDKLLLVMFRCNSYCISLHCCINSHNYKYDHQCSETNTGRMCCQEKGMTRLLTKVVQSLHYLDAKRAREPLRKDAHHRKPWDNNKLRVTNLDSSSHISGQKWKELSRTVCYWGNVSGGWNWNINFFPVGFLYLKHCFWSIRYQLHMEISSLTLTATPRTCGQAASIWGKLTLLPRDCEGPFK